MNRAKDNKTLTRAEMEIMNYLWDLKAGGGTVRDVLACYDEPQPHLIATLFNGCAFGPPLPFTATSSWTWVDHALTFTVI